MKIHFLILLLPFFTHAQNSIPTDTIVISKTFAAEANETYLDSVKVDMSKTYLDPDNIKETKIFKTDNARLYSSNKGATLITRTVKNELVSLDNIIESVKKSSSTLRGQDNITLVINGKLIEHPEEYYIEATAIKKLNILENNSTGHLHMPPTIVITTKGYKK